MFELKRRLLSVARNARLHVMSIGFVLASMGQQAIATPTGVAGYVGNLDVVGSGGGAPGNYDFRIFLTTNEVICNGQTWAYINTNDGNYSALVASILSAKATGGIVTLYVTPVGAYCQLAFVVIN
jgi:hypothetical protein